jgi:hypothetical protein
MSDKPAIWEYGLPSDLPFLPVKYRFRYPDDAYRIYRTPDGLARLQRALGLLQAWTEARSTLTEWRAFGKRTAKDSNGPLMPIPDKWPDKARLLFGIRCMIDAALRELEAGHVEEAAALYHERIEAAITELQRRLHDNPPRSPAGHPRSHNPELIENILQWMRGRLRLGSGVDELTEENYVRYRWPDRYGNEDDLPEGHPVYLLRAIRDRTSKRRAAKRSIQSGTRLLRKQMEPFEDTWETLKQRALLDE